MKTLQIILTALITASVISIFSLPCLAESPKESIVRYVGSVACRDCHEREYYNFVTYARKRQSFESVARLKSTLTKAELIECYSCHTTGYGKPGGFISPEETPHLMNTGCEVCHGPGETHVRSGGQGKINRNLTDKDCEVCHISERISSFGVKPLIHGGAH